jgi:hypothetical protein
MMRQKLLTLCIQTFEVAKKMKNFSSWVRKELKAYDEGEDREYWKEKCEDLNHTLRKVREDGLYWDEEFKTWRFPK